MINGKDIKWKELISSGEWLGREFADEIDRARRDKLREQRQSDKEIGEADRIIEGTSYLISRPCWESHS